MKVFYFWSALKFKTPPDAVIFTGSAHLNESETGQLKRCTYIREAFQEKHINSNTRAKLL
jgi:hypothetical protein